MELWQAGECPDLQAALLPAAIKPGTPVAYNSVGNSAPVKAIHATRAGMGYLRMLSDEISAYHDVCWV
ncbi:MAG: hypothetical protein EP344_00110 [Bacteroidetes bacterium]|nr:MAG: hypothetical protein EP344_00110 [Bacteroidota bacterium]